MALSATVVAVGPGVTYAAEAGAGSSGWAAASVRFEPVAQGAGGITVVGLGSYRGAIDVRRNGRSVAVVNDVAFEDYVRGIDEVPASWPAAALQAQAIAARTYAAHWATGTGASPWRAVGADICATPRCQVYRGLIGEQKAQGHGWLAAVEATAGRVLLSGNRPILASYSSTANGPLAMSQNGALAMAQEGRSANEILAAYYGVRPTFAPAQVPAAIRVALSTSAPTARISATEPFRVLDGGGTELAVSGPGEWKVVPDGDGVRVLAPDGFASAPALAVEPAAAAVRLPSRVVTADAPGTGRAPWAMTALALALASGSLAITQQRRRRA